MHLWECFSFSNCVAHIFQVGQFMMKQDNLYSLLAFYNLPMSAVSLHAKLQHFTFYLCSESVLNTLSETKILWK